MVVPLIFLSILAKNQSGVMTAQKSVLMAVGVKSVAGVVSAGSVIAVVIGHVPLAQAVRVVLGVVQVHLRSVGVTVVLGVIDQPDLLPNPLSLRVSQPPARSAHKAANPVKSVRQRHLGLIRASVANLKHRAVSVMTNQKHAVKASQTPGWMPTSRHAAS